MDLQSFIQSGLLEAYVAGQCDATQRKEVEHMAAQHPEIRAELDNIEQALENFALANAVPPPPGLKSRILDQINNNTDMPDSTSTSAPKSGNGSLRLYQVLTVALAALASFFFWQRMFESAKTEELNKKVMALQTQVDDCGKRNIQSENMATLLRDTDTHPVALSDGYKHTYHITVFYNKLREGCVLDIQGLPLPEKGKYFQCWAIVDEKPVSLGMVQMDALLGLQTLQYVKGATAFAISEEESPEGHPTPTRVIANGPVEG